MGGDVKNVGAIPDNSNTNSKLCVQIYEHHLFIDQMAALELHDNEGPVSKEAISKAVEGLEQPMQKVYN